MDTNEFVQSEMAKNDKKIFAGSILTILVGYVGISFWLNSIRATASLWFVWVLIAAQVLLYFFLFYNSYKRSKMLGLSNGLALILFVILAVLGRVENWELVIIPMLVIVMLVFSGRNLGKKNEV